MINRRVFLARSAAGLPGLLGATAKLSRHPGSSGFVLDLTELRGVGTEYRIDPYLQCASGLQAVGQRAAVRQMQAEATRLERSPLQHFSQSEALIILCRMLFAGAPGNTFRRPGLGMMGILGGASSSAWPTEPIEVVQGIPFLITNGYTLDGRAEWCWDYLSYCVKECSWNAFRYQPAGEVEKRKALTALLASPKWKRRLEDWERKFLIEQI